MVQLVIENLRNLQKVLHNISKNKSEVGQKLIDTIIWMLITVIHSPASNNDEGLYEQSVTYEPGVEESNYDTV